MTELSPADELEAIRRALNPTWDGDVVALARVVQAQFNHIQGALEAQTRQRNAVEIERDEAIAERDALRKIVEGT